MIFVYTMITIDKINAWVYTDFKRCSMTIVIGAREARQKFADLLGRVGYGKEVAIVERSGKPMVAVIPVELYEQLVAEREARFQVVKDIRVRLPEFSEDETAEDIAQALREMRAGRAAGGG